MDKTSQTSSSHFGAVQNSGGGARKTPPTSSAAQASPRAVHTGSRHNEEGAEGCSPRAIEALTHAMARGDDEAFREFYDAYFDRLLRYLLVVAGGNEQAAREALQATFLRVVRHVKVFDAEEKFWSWLTVLARSALADESKKQRRWLAFLERFSRHKEMENLTANEGEADAMLRELLEQGVSSLPLDERELIAQKYMMHHTVRQIAQTQQTTEKAVESKLSRIRLKLKNAMLAGLQKNGGEH